MSRNQRIGLIVGAVVVALLALKLLSPGDDEGGGGRATETTRIEIRGAEVAGGPADIKVTKGDRVRIVVASDADDRLHLHGYDIEKEAGPGKPARFELTADVEGIFEIESHSAEDAGRDPVIAKLTVEPG